MSEVREGVLVLGAMDYMGRSMEVLQTMVIPCAHCGAGGLLEKKGNSIRHYVVKCEMCRAVVKGTFPWDAVENWNRRPGEVLVPLAESSFLLPEGQAWEKLMIVDNHKNVIRFTDGESVDGLEISLGHFSVCVRVRSE